MNISKTSLMNTKLSIKALYLQRKYQQNLVEINKNIFNSYNFNLFCINYYMLHKLGKNKNISRFNNYFEKIGAEIIYNICHLNQILPKNIFYIYVRKILVLSKNYCIGNFKLENLCEIMAKK
jgi:hypothetical protein